MLTDFDERLSELVDSAARPEQLATGYRFLEGPVWNASERYLVYCDWQEHRIQKWSERDGVTVFREGSNSATGLTYAPDGTLLAAEMRASRGNPDGGRRVARIYPDGRSETVVDRHDGGRFSSPNDLVCLANGDIVFTDPDIGLSHSDGTKDPREVSSNGVYRFKTADGTLQLVTGAFESPNGIVKRDDSSELLVVNHRTIESVDLETGSASLFSDLTHGDLHGGADGMKLDALGNLYVSGGAEGVWVISPEAKVLGFINVGEPAINLAWGGDDWKTLFVVSRQSLYRLPMKVAGQQLNPR